MLLTKYGWLSNFFLLNVANKMVHLSSLHVQKYEYFMTFTVLAYVQNNCTMYL